MDGESARPRRESDSSVLKRTGRSWEDWFGVLDTWHATEHSHADIARWLADEHATGTWWAQAIAVAYEADRGMRRPSGTYAISASKTVDVNVDRLYWAFTDIAARSRWLPDATFTVISSTPPRSLRAIWNQGPTRIAVAFNVKGPTKSQVALAHEQLPDAEEAAHMKAYWRERVKALKQLLEG